MSSSPLWLCLSILGLASVGIISNVACIAILTFRKRSSMFHNLLKVYGHLGFTLFLLTQVLGELFKNTYYNFAQQTSDHN